MSNFLQTIESLGDDCARVVLSATAKTASGRVLSAEEKDVKAALEPALREMARCGMKPDDKYALAAFIQSVVQRDAETIPDEALSQCFAESSIGEDDYVETVMPPENTLVAYEAAQGGNVPASYLNPENVGLKTKNLQIDTFVTYRNMRNNPWNSVSALTEFAGLALRGGMFRTVFGDLDALITQVVNGGGAQPTQDEADELAAFAFSNGLADSALVARAKYIFTIGGFTYASQVAADEAHRSGVPALYRGVRMLPVRETSGMTANQLFPDERIYAIAGKIGTLVTRGDVSVFVDEDNKTEQFHIMFKNFVFDWGFTHAGLARVMKWQAA